jgi:hypothetical protein
VGGDALQPAAGIVVSTTREIQVMSIQQRLSCLSAFAFTALLASAALAGTKAADHKAVLGEWEITIERSDFEDADVEITLEIEEDEDGQLIGTWNTPRGDEDLEDVEWDGKKLTFVRVVEVLGREVDVEHTVKIKGNKLEGEMEFPRRDVDFSGRRED